MRKVLLFVISWYCFYGYSQDVAIQNKFSNTIFVDQWNHLNIVVEGMFCEDLIFEIRSSNEKDSIKTKECDLWIKPFKLNGDIDIVISKLKRKDTIQIRRERLRVRYAPKVGIRFPASSIFDSVSLNKFKAQAGLIVGNAECYSFDVKSGRVQSYDLLLYRDAVLLDSIHGKGALFRGTVKNLIRYKIEGGDRLEFDNIKVVRPDGRVISLEKKVYLMKGPKSENKNSDLDIDNTVYDEAVLLYEQKEYEKAIALFKVIVKERKSFVGYYKCLFNVASIYHELDRLDSAKVWYEKIRNSTADDSEFGGRSLMETHSNYKHNATFYLANIAYNAGDYERSIVYYNESLDKYPDRTTSLTSYQINRNTTIFYIVDALEQLGRYEEALLIILPAVLDSEGNKSYSWMKDRALKLIDTSFNRSIIKIELDSALQTLRYEDNTERINFRGNVLNLASYDAYRSDIESFLKAIKASAFYLELSKE